MVLPTSDSPSIKTQSQNQWTDNKTSPTYMQSVGELQMKKLRH